MTGTMYPGAPYPGEDYDPIEGAAAEQAGGIGRHRKIKARPPQPPVPEPIVVPALVPILGVAAAFAVQTPAVAAGAGLFVPFGNGARASVARVGVVGAAAVAVEGRKATSAVGAASVAAGAAVVARGRASVAETNALVLALAALLEREEAA